MPTATSIRCGNCGNSHGSVNAVKACYNEADKTSQPTFAQQRAQATKQDEGATDKQVAFLRTLLAERDHGYPDPDLVLTTLAKNKRVASAAITLLLDCGKVAQPTTAATASNGTAVDTDVPEGYYAVTSATGNNDLDFYVVQRPTEGRWAGYVFVKTIIGGHPEYAIKGAKRDEVLARIASAGWHEAALLYGQEIGRCGKCNRTLTDETSRAYGIGPVCREAGW